MLALDWEPGAAGAFTFEELRLAVEASSLRRQREREHRVALAAQSVHTLAYYLGLPHPRPGEAKKWLSIIPSPQELFEAWTGARAAEPVKEEGARPRRPGARAGRPRTVESVLEDLEAWGIDPADREAWEPRTSVELQAYLRARQASKG